jgi:hypothetical protein
MKRRLTLTTPIVILGSALILRACATASSTQVIEATSLQKSSVLTDVLVVRDGARWSAEFTFHRDAPVWMFMNSALTRADGQPWRPRSWIVETQGVRMERRGWHEVFFAEDGGPVPRKVSVRFTPFTAGLQAAYEPARVFTDGSVALYTGQFNVAPLATLAEADAMPMDLNGVPLEGGGRSQVTFRDRSGPVLFRGERQDPAVAVDGQSYVLFGKIPLHEIDALVTVLDPGLPKWISDQLADFTPRILALYADRLGSGLRVRPTVMVSWAGPTRARRSMGGDVLPGLLVIEFEGDGVAVYTPQVESLARSFIAHEGAHFWLGQQVRYQRVRDSWITEGGADLLAVRATSAIDSTYRAIDRLQEEVDDCVRLSAGKAIYTAAERSEHRAYYACGATFGLLAEAVMKRNQGDFFTFVRALIEANRQDEVVTGREWLDELTRVSADPSLSADILRMLDEGVADPATLIGSMFSRVGVAHEVRDGRLLLPR